MWIVVEPPEEEPVTLERARMQIRVTTNDGSPGTTPHDAILEDQIRTAREYIEQASGRRFMEQTLERSFSSWPCKLDITPVQSITHIKYIDNDGVLQTLATDQYSLEQNEPPVIHRGFDVIYPVIRYVWNAVTVRVVAGYATADAVPQMAKQAILMLMAHWFENREDTSPVEIRSVPRAVSDLIDRIRVYT